MEFKKLFEPGTIGKMEVKNRIVMAPVNSRFGGEFGAVTQRWIDYYVERAKGGTGLIIVENNCVDWPLGKADGFLTRLDEDRFIPGFHDLAEAVHPYGAKIASQLQHAGRNTTLANTEGLQPVAPSVLISYRGTVAREVTIPEIEVIAGKFAEAARRTKEAGFDAVEMHGAHGYLFTQFLSPLTNKRNDMYGGSFENRMRFAVEVIERTREKVGPDFPIIFRFSVDEYLPGGVDLEEGKRIARRLEEAGVDAIDVSAGTRESAGTVIMPNMAVPRGCFVHLAARIKEVVSIPVIVVGRINDPILAEEILDQGKADFVTLGRQMLADPYFAEKAARGALDDIRPCIACNECLVRLYRKWRLGCSVNAEAGKEREYELKRAERSRRVLVAGGGPAGMEAARVAALRGHQVTLYEKGQQLGGQLLLASVPSFKKEIEGFIKYLVRQLEKVGVRVELGREVTRDLVKEEKPEVVIVATGARPLIPSISGIERKEVVTAEAVLAGEAKVGKRVVVAGGGRVGVEIACHLEEEGASVTLVEMTGEIGADLEPVMMEYLLGRLKEHGMRVLTQRKVEAITGDGVKIVDREWRGELLAADTVVLALGAQSNGALLQELKGIDVEVHAIGDCAKPRTMYEAVHEGAQVGRLI